MGNRNPLSPTSPSIRMAAHSISTLTLSMYMDYHSMVLAVLSIPTVDTSR